MATTYLQLLNGTATGDVLSAANWNKVTGSQDRGGGQMMAALFGGGVKTGWSISSGASTVTSGTGQVGPCWCATAAAQAISGVAAASTLYVFAKTIAGSPASGTVTFAARTTSAAVTNYDGVTSALCLGSGKFRSGSGFVTVSTTLRDTWAIDHGTLAGLTDDDHPDYMRPIEQRLSPLTALAFATSAATVSNNGTNCPTPVVKFPADSTTKTAWEYECPADYSGTITIRLDWLSSGTAGPVRLVASAKAIGSAETWDAALTSCLAAQQVTISGTAGHLRRTSFLWTATKPSAGERGIIQLRRDGANASDTMSGIARLIGGRITFATAR